MSGLGITYQSPGGTLPTLTLTPASLSAASASGSSAGQVTVAGASGGTWSLATTGPFAINATTGALTTTGAVTAGTYTASVTYSFTSGADTYTVSAALSIPVGVSLATLLLSTTSFTQGAAPGVTLATISGQTAGSTVSIAASDTTGDFAVDSTGTLLKAGLNYDSLTAGATPTVALTEALAGAANSPHTTSIGVTIASAATVVSASNRTRIGRATQGGTLKPSTYQYLLGHTVHTTVVQINVETLQPYYFNGYASNPYDSVPASQIMTLRGAYITNVQGLANIGTTGASLNQTGATITPYSYNGVISGATQLYGDTTGANCAQPRTYAQFVADGGSVSTVTHTNDTIVAPPGYLFAPDPLPSALAAQTSYILRTENYVPLNSYYVINSVQWYGNSQSPLRYQVNSTGDYTKGYNSSSMGAPANSSSVPMVYDPNWSTYSGVAGGTNYDVGPVWVIGQSAGGAKTHIAAGCSINEGNLDYGDPYGTCGLVQRALFNKGLPQITTAIAGSTVSGLKEAGVVKAGALRMLAFRTFTAGGGNIITDDGRNDAGIGWPAAGSYTAASPDDTTAPANDMAAIRWLAKYHMRPNMSSSSKLIRITSISPGSTAGAYANAATINGATYNGTTITYTVGSTANLINGENVQIRGMAPAVYNAYGAITIINSTSFSMVVTTAPTAAPTTATGYVDDGGQSAAGIPANTSTTYAAGGAGYLMNDHAISRNSYAGQTLSAGAGDHDACLDCDGALGYYTQSNPLVWPVASSFQSETADFTHTGWAANQRAMPAIAAALAATL
jgi:hypothetical protein